MIVYEARPSWPDINERKVKEIKGQRVYYIHNGKLRFDMKITSYSAIFETKEEAKQYCIDYANNEIKKYEESLNKAKEYLKLCQKL